MKIKGNEFQTKCSEKFTTFTTVYRVVFLVEAMF